MVVLLKEDSIGSPKWELGKIVNIIKVADGKVRVVDVQTGLKRRSLSHISPLRFSTHKTLSTLSTP